MADPRADLAAERYVLGAVLLDNACLADVDAACAPADMHAPAHTTIFEAMRALAARGEPVDPITLAAELRARNRLDSVGGPTYLARLSDACSTAHVARHAQALAELAACRRLERVGRAIAAKAADPMVSPADAVAFAQAEVVAAGDAACGKRTGREAVAIDDVLMETFEELDAARLAGRPVGIQTGFTELDRLLGAIPPGDYVLLGGRPSQGKTALALNLALNAARGGVPTLVYSLEMQRKKLGRRLLAMDAGVDATAVRLARLTADQLGRLTESAQRMVGLPLWVDDLGALSAASLASATRKHVHRHGPLGLLVIDYIGLMDGDGRAENTEKELKGISKAIKQLAMGLGCVALVLAQLSRRCEERADKRPMLSDLRDSGSLEQDADAVLFVYRDEYYNKRTKDAGVAEVIVAKQRDGATGTARLSFARELTRFGNLEPTPQAAPARPHAWHDDVETHDHAAE